MTLPAAADLEAFIDAAAAMVDLPVAAAHRPGVARFLALAAEMAAALEAVELDETELALAPVFTPSAGGGARDE